MTIEQTKITLKLIDQRELEKIKITEDMIVDGHITKEWTLSVEYKGEIYNLSAYDSNTRSPSIEVWESILELQVKKEEEYKALMLIKKEMINKVENLNGFQQEKLQKYFENIKVELDTDYSIKCSQSERDIKRHNIYDCGRMIKAIKSLEMHQLKPLKKYIEEMECKRCGWE